LRASLLGKLLGRRFDALRSAVKDVGGEGFFPFWALDALLRDISVEGPSQQAGVDLQRLAVSAQHAERACLVPQREGTIRGQFQRWSRWLMMAYLPGRRVSSPFYTRVGTASLPRAARQYHIEAEEMIGPRRLPP
jgi:hypothetical protein